MPSKRQTHVTPEDEPAPTGRLVFGRDIMCKYCKGTGEKFDPKKNEKYPCYGCGGKGYRNKED